MDCPYNALPPTSWWGRAVAGAAPGQVDPHLPGALRITPGTLVASAGSCFAQHISRALVGRGYNYHVAEPAPGRMSAEQALRYNYGVFSARYGNVYTSLQFLQLVQRADGAFVPQDQFWRNGDGRWFDLLRPRIAPQGYASRAEAEADNRQHLAAVRRLLETTEVFVFTLGLTECWRARVDGTAYPTCPGCGSAGDYDDAKYVFHNLTVAETTAQLLGAIDLITARNPAIQFVLTVSPVPLVATMEPRHVLQATSYSKSVLRVAAEEALRQRPNVHYFASYEIITATRNTQAYIGADGRTIAPEGVARAMALFFAHFTGVAAGEGAPRALSDAPAPPPAAIVGDVVGDVVCDEDDFYRALARHVI